MTRFKDAIPVGTRVRFLPKVFEEPYAPHFDEYEGHEFEVVGYGRDDNGEPYQKIEWLYDHVWLKCVTGNVVVRGCVHDCDLEKV